MKIIKFLLTLQRRNHDIIVLEVAHQDRSFDRELDHDEVPDELPAPVQLHSRDP